jgi:hypothetical protein
MTKETTVTFPGPGMFKVTFTPMEAKPESVRHWVTSPVIGETIEVATKADFSDAYVGEVTRIDNDHTIRVRKPSGSIVWVPSYNHHTRRPVDTRPCPLPPVDRRTLPLTSLEPGDAIEYRNGSRDGCPNPYPWMVGVFDGFDCGIPVVRGQGRREFQNIRWPQPDAAPNWQAQAESLERQLKVYREGHSRMVKQASADEATIAAKDAEIARLLDVQEAHMRVGGERLSAIAANEKTIAELRAVLSIANRDAESLRAQLAQAQKDQRQTQAAHESVMRQVCEWQSTAAKAQSETFNLRAQLATAERDFSRVIDFLGGGQTWTADHAVEAIRSLKSESRLVLHSDTLERHPLPWHVDGRAIYSAKSTKVGVIDLANVPYALDGEVAELVVNAANRAVKS